MEYWAERTVLSSAMLELVPLAPEDNGVIKNVEEFLLGAIKWCPCKALAGAEGMLIEQFGTAAAFTLYWLRARRHELMYGTMRLFHLLETFRTVLNDE